MIYTLAWFAYGVLVAMILIGKESPLLSMTTEVGTEVIEDYKDL